MAEQVICKRINDDEIEAAKQKLITDTTDVLKKEIVDKSHGLVMVVLGDGKKRVMFSTTFGKLTDILPVLFDLKNKGISDTIKKILESTADNH